MTVAEHPTDELRPAFARHETFHPRYGWLKKGFDSAVDDAECSFAATRRHVLGVGKNMVRAIRYWCLAYKVLMRRRRKENPRPQRRDTD